MNKALFLMTCLTITLLTACNDDPDNNQPKTVTLPISETPLDVSIVGRYNENQVFDKGMSEIVAFHNNSQSILVTNANEGALDILSTSDLSDKPMENPLSQGNLTFYTRIYLKDHIAEAGGINSVAVFNDLIAVAVAHKNKQQNGFIAFFSIDANAQTLFIQSVKAGALPDNVVFTKDGQYVLSANEGEPSGDYKIDPEGSVTVVSITNNKPDKVKQVNFRAFNQGGDLNTLIDSGIRISGPNATVSQDLEPEYIAVSDDSKIAYVSLQENNAYAVIDIVNGKAINIKPLGFKDHGKVTNALDASNKDDGIHITTYENLFGLYMPDTIQTYTIKGVNYLVTANEGDSREYTYEASESECLDNGHNFDDDTCFSWVDETRVKHLTLDPDFFPDSRSQEDNQLGRLKALTTMGDSNNDGLNEAIYSFGGRSFSIFNADTGEIIFDSGKDFEQKTAEILKESGFNSTNDDNDFDDRSDDKGPEPEALAIGTIKGQTYAFIGLERTGGIMIYNITDPQSVKFDSYHYNRNFSADIENNLEQAGDLAPEGMAFIDASLSPTGNALLIVGNEVSGTTTVYQLK